MMKSTQSPTVVTPTKGNEAQPPNPVTGAVELIVTPEMRAAIERKRVKCEKVRELGEQSASVERGEIDLGEI